MFVADNVKTMITGAATHNLIKKAGTFGSRPFFPGGFLAQVFLGALTLSELG